MPRRRLLRTVDAALELIDSVEEFNRPRAVLGLIQLPARVAVASGSVFLGNIGTYHKMEFTAIGNAVNLAARLVAEAEVGRPCVSQETRDLIGERFRFAGQGPRSLDLGGLGRGGGIDNANRATAIIIGTLIGNNQAIGGGGTVTGGDGLGGGIYNEVRSDVTLRSCTVTGNQAIGGGGPTAGSGLGGGVYNTAGGTVWVDLVTAILANEASTGEDDVFGILTPL